MAKKRDRISESDLVLPSLYLMAYADGKATTATLKTQLFRILRPTGEDLEILGGGRRDAKWTQIVRNLKSHNTFENLGYARYERKGNAREGEFVITQEGREFLERHREELTYLVTTDFALSDVIPVLRDLQKNPLRRAQGFDENVLIGEGQKGIAQRAVVERSKKLRDIAIEHFAVAGRISCRACEFNYNDFYGAKAAKGYIEIHHVKPIRKFEDEDLVKSVEAALGNLMPVCANCHRVIHRERDTSLEHVALVAAIKSNSLYRGRKTW